MKAPAAATPVLRRLAPDTSAFSLIELGLVLPILMTLGLYGAEIASMATANMQISQIALSTADNASRLEQADNSAVTPTVTETDVNSVLQGAIQQGGRLDLLRRGRVILTSLERDPATGKQYIHWQRCIGDLAGAASLYGNDRDRNGLSGAPITGMGSGAAKVTAPTDPYQAVMFVEVVYRYDGLFKTLFIQPTTFRQEGAYLSRDSRNIAAGLTGTRRNGC